MFQYAELNAQGLITRLIEQTEALPPDVMQANHLLPFVEEAVQYDSNTQKSTGKEIVVENGVAKRRNVVVPKTDDDLYQEALERRRMALPAEESLELLSAILNRLVNWAALQADPAKPWTIFQISKEEIAALDTVDATLQNIALPDDRKKLPTVARKSTT